MENLRKKRGISRGKITRAQTKVSEYVMELPDDIVVGNLKTMLTILEAAWSEFSATQEAIMMHANADEDDEAAELDAEEKRYCDTRGKLMMLIKQFAPNPASGTGSSASTVVPPPRVGTGHLKLPKIDLPTFSGQYGDWTSFYDLFRASVDANGSLTKAQKLQYLKASLKGEASKLLTSLTVTDDHYDGAKQLLEERFQNKRAIVKAHVAALMSAPSARNNSAVTLRKLIEVFQENVMALALQSVPVAEWDVILVYLMHERLDEETRRQWELASAGTDLQQYKELVAFLELRCRAYEASALASGSSDGSGGKPSGGPKTRFQTQASYHSQAPAACIACKGHGHRLWGCAEFKKLDPDARYELVKEARLCFNCFGDHRVHFCTNNRNCMKCQSKHNTLLHRESNIPPASQNATKPPATVNAGHVAESSSSVLLATAMVPIGNQWRRPCECRALLDSGSQANFISEACVKRLGIRKRHSNVRIIGVGSSAAADSLGSVEFVITPAESAPITVEALVMKQITQSLPSATFQIADWEAPKTLRLADPHFNRRGFIDLLLGAEVYEKIVLERKRKESESIYLRETVFGWVISGRIQDDQESNTPLQANHVVTADPDSSLRRFFEIEEVPTASKHSPEELQCEQHFVDTTTRDHEGRFVVKLPFKRDAKPLGDSFRQASKRFKGLLVRLRQNPPLAAKYTEFVREFQELGHLEDVPAEDLEKPCSQHFYLPHHAVFKESSTTTKLRVVFDGSAKTEAGPSLNESLMVGPKVQDDIFGILVRFRSHAVALSADIAKMYRQIALSPEDRDFHRILWCDSLDGPLKHLRMTRVTYGIASSSFHSIRAMQELARVEKPELLPVVMRDFYVDDLLSGANSVCKAKELQQNLIALFRLGGCDLRKWMSNHQEVFDNVGAEMQEVTLDVPLSDSDHRVKALGISWRPGTDSFSFSVSDFPTGNITKRIFLSDTAKIFDPMGWLAPMVIKLKCLFQQCWVLGVGWDEVLPDSIVQEWLLWRESFPVVAEFQLPRCTTMQNAVDSQLHIFCDASEVAFAAAVYLRVEDDTGAVQVRLLTSKTRVAPVKTISIPRLELCGAVLAAKLYKAVCRAFEDTEVCISSTTMWTDSTIVLSWLAELPRKWTTFVANRVTIIQEETEHCHWRHVPSEDNPADCASRGLLPGELVEFQMWWTGPVWLSGAADNWPQLLNRDPSHAPERKPVSAVVLTVTVRQFPVDISRYSSLSAVKRVLAWMLRFINNARLPRQDRCLGVLSASELKESLRRLVVDTQEEQFGNEIECLRNGKELSSTSRLLSLTPFLDEDTGVLRVGGRLSQSDYSLGMKHPMLLGRNGHLVQLLVRDAHARTLHGGNTVTITALRLNFWILRVRDVVRQCIRTCIKCLRFSQKAAVPIMADLPEERIVHTRPFDNTGLDFAGPLLIKGGDGKSSKAYVALFVCFSTKAIHLELVSALTTEACIAALRRFVSRRSCPSTMFTDNGTNFVGARNELVDLQKILASVGDKASLGNFAAAHGIQWVMIPPRAPHFGGLWEAGVKSAKHHLRRIVGNTVLTFEELTTVLTQIESVLNSRPLTALSTDPNDCQALTPGHFLVGGSLLSLPELQVSKKKGEVVQRWHLLQSMAHNFWRRWRLEYVSSLQQRKKWKKDAVPLQEGDLVLVAEDNMAPLKWLMGRVTKLFTGNDCIPRVAQVKVQDKLIVRPVVKLHVLPVNSPSTEC